MNVGILRPKRSRKSTIESINPILAKGEIFFEIPDSGLAENLGKIKMGDGSTSYNELPYFLNPTSLNLSNLDGNIVFKNANQNFRGILGNLLNNTIAWKIAGMFNDSNPCVEISTTNLNTEMIPIIVKQTSSLSSRTLNLLDESGDTYIPGNLSIEGNILEKGTLNSVDKADYAEAFDYEGEYPEVGYIVELAENKKVRLASYHSEKAIGISSNGYWVLAGSSIDNVENKSKVAVGLIGQLPIKVIGKVSVGDRIVSNGNGIGIVDNSASPFEVVAKAMESNDDENLKDVYCVVK